MIPTNRDYIENELCDKSYDFCLLPHIYSRFNLMGRNILSGTLCGVVYVGSCAVQSFVDEQSYLDENEGSVLITKLITKNYKTPTIASGGVIKYNSGTISLCWQNAAAQDCHLVCSYICDGVCSSFKTKCIWHSIDDD